MIFIKSHRVHQAQRNQLGHPRRPELPPIGVVEPQHPILLIAISRPKVNQASLFEEEVKMRRVNFHAGPCPRFPYQDFLQPRF